MTINFDDQSPASPPFNLLTIPYDSCSLLWRLSGCKKLCAAFHVVAPESRRKVSIVSAQRLKPSTRILLLPVVNLVFGPSHG